MYVRKRFEGPTLSGGATTAPKRSMGQQANNRRQPAPDGFAPPRKQPKADPDSALAARIRSLQDKQNPSPTGTKGFGFADPWKARPETIRDDVLHTLGVTRDAKRSRTIIDGLKKMNILSDQNELKASLQHAENIVLAVRPEKLSDGQALSAREVQGLVALLTGIDNRMQDLGRNIYDLPPTRRAMFFFYAGLVKSPDESVNMALQFCTNGILGNDVLPKDGGDAFTRYVDQLVSQHKVRYPQRSPAAIVEKYAAIREALFALPNYEKPPPYRG